MICKTFKIRMNLTTIWLLSPLGHMSVAGILDVVIDRGSVVGTVTVGIEVILLEIELAGIV